MKAREYFAIQLQMIGIGHQVKALKGLPEYVETSEHAAKSEVDRPDDENFQNAKVGLACVRRLGLQLLEVQKTILELDEHMAKMPIPPEIREQAKKSLPHMRAKAP